MGRKLHALVGSPILWIGTAGSAVCLLIVCSGGNLGPLAFAHRFGPNWFPWILLGWLALGSISFPLMVGGLIIGIIRLRWMLKHGTEADAAKQPSKDDWPDDGA